MSSIEWIDSHVHLTDQRWGEFPEAASSLVLQAKARGAKGLVMAGVDPEDWERQLILQEVYPKLVWPVLGLHPYEVVKYSSVQLDGVLDSLASRLHHAVALGETGLDLRPRIVQDKLELQYQAFEAQFELAEVAGKPLVLHLVQAFEEAMTFFEVWGAPRNSAMVHSFNGSAHQAEKYLELGMMISVGGPVTRDDNQRLHQAVRVIPLDQLLIESDGPDQPAAPYQGLQNPPWSVLDVALKVSQIKKNISVDDVLSMTSKNAERFFKLC